MNDAELEDLLNAALQDFDTVPAAAPAGIAGARKTAFAPMAPMQPPPRVLPHPERALPSMSSPGTPHAGCCPAAAAAFTSAAADEGLSFSTPTSTPATPKSATATAMSAPAAASEEASVPAAASTSAPRGGLLALERRKPRAVPAGTGVALPQVAPATRAVLPQGAASDEAQMLMADLLRFVHEVQAGGGEGPGVDHRTTDGADGDDEAEPSAIRGSGDSNADAAAAAAALAALFGGSMASAPAAGATGSLNLELAHAMAGASTGAPAPVGTGSEVEEEDTGSAAVRALMQRTKATVAQQSRYARGESTSPASAPAAAPPGGGVGGLASLLGGLASMGGLGGLVGQGSLGTGSDSEGGAGSMLVESIMRSLLSKEMLHGPLQEIRDRYPPWLSENEDKLPAAAFTRYVGQYAAVQRVCKQYEEGPDDFAAIVDCIQEMQEFGDPPAEIVDQIAGGMPAGLLGGGGGSGNVGEGAEDGDAAVNWDNLHLPEGSNIMSELEALMQSTAAGRGAGAARGEQPQCPMQ